MATVETLFQRQLTDDEWMDKGACKGLTHLFFPSPAERPGTRPRCIAGQGVPRRS